MTLPSSRSKKLGRAATDDAQAARDLRASQAPLMRRIRSELNLEKWSLWAPARSSAAPKVRYLKREITTPDGNRLNATVEVGTTHRGALNTSDQKVLYGLIKLWEDAGRTGDAVKFSLRHLAATLKKEWSVNTKRSIVDSLLRLRLTPFVWTNSYYDRKTGERYSLLDTFNILTEMKIATRETAAPGESKALRNNRDSSSSSKSSGSGNTGAGGNRNARNTAECVFKINDLITTNLLLAHSKPVMLDTVINFKSDLAQMLYTHLDLIMAKHLRYERLTADLFADLDLKTETYQSLAERRRALEKAITELQGLPLSTGILASVRLEPSRSRAVRDLKIVFVKAMPADATRDEVFTGTEGELKITDALSLVEQFYRKFHSVETVRPSERELQLAQKMLDDYGDECSLFIVEYSRQLAPITNYQPQIFGGIVHYAPRAAAEYRRLNESPRGFASPVSSVPDPTAVFSDLAPTREAELLWSKTLKELRERGELDVQAIEAWLGASAVRAIKVDNLELKLKPVSPIVREWIDDNFRAKIEAALSVVSKQKVTGIVWQ